MSTEKLLIVANWKMNPSTLKGAKLLFNSVKKGIKRACPEQSQRVEVVICPPFPYLSNFEFRISNFELGAQDCFWEERGAFTGEVSPKMLKDLGCQYVIIGHSERRKYFKETNEMLSKKIKAVLKAGLKPILCIDKISQIPNDIEPRPFLNKGRGKIENLIIAFEPVFAIGTGKPCSIEKAKRIRKRINNNFVLYGGSVNSQNARDYITTAEFQGLLVGGASLDPKEFVEIVKSISRG